MTPTSRRHRAALIAIGAVLAIAPAYGATGNGVTGRWFTDGFERGDHLEVFFDIRANGTYEKDIRIIENCDIAAHAKEGGKWTFQRGSLATVSETLDGKPVTGSPTDTHDLFTVTRVDEEHINLFDTETKINWGLMLVAPDFPFPAARGCGV